MAKEIGQIGVIVPGENLNKEHWIEQAKAEGFNAVEKTTEDGKVYYELYDDGKKKN